MLTPNLKASVGHFRVGRWRPQSDIYLQSTLHTARYCDGILAKLLLEVMSDANEEFHGDRVSFLVQIFGIHEITDSFDNNSLLVSQLFKDKIDEVSNNTKIQCIFVFQDVKSLVGYGDIMRKEETKVSLRCKSAQFTNDCVIVSYVQQ